MNHMELDLWSTLILFISLGIASWQDYRTQTVPKLFTWAMVIVGLLLPSPWGTISWRLVGGCITLALVVGLLLFFPDGLGGSDARVLVAFGAYFGQAFPVFIILIGLCQPVCLLVLYYRAWRSPQKNGKAQNGLTKNNPQNTHKNPEKVLGAGGPYLPFLLIVAAVCFGLLQ
mgnify:CR=1 FL=1